MERVPDAPIEDLDDPTNVLDGKRTTQNRAAARKPGEPAKPRKPSTSQVDEGFETLFGAATPTPPPSAPPTPAPAPPAVAMLETLHGIAPPVIPLAPPPPVHPAPTPAPPAVAAAAPAQASPAAAPAPPAGGLLAQRVVVVAGRDGEARVLAVEGLTSVPEGAIFAIVVPLAAGDGEPLARLLRGRATE